MAKHRQYDVEMPLHICNLTGTARLIPLQTIICLLVDPGSLLLWCDHDLTGQHWWTHVALSMLPNAMLLLLPWQIQQNILSACFQMMCCIVMDVIV